MSAWVRMVFVSGMIAAIGACAPASPPPPLDPSVSATDLQGAQLNGKANCLDQGAGVVAGLGLDLANVRSVNGVEQVVGHGDNKAVRGLDLWFRFRDREGAVVVNLDTQCRPFSYYTRGGLTVAAPTAS
ncbi:MAG: hypothetical protein QNJ84_02635 [Alphaproteobacteria bacterium]|nr:hypothetical protein [Alphaproteobacteria bacterium]